MICSPPPEVACRSFCPRDVSAFGSLNPCSCSCVSALGGCSPSGSAAGISRVCGGTTCPSWVCSSAALFGAPHAKQNLKVSSFSISPQLAHAFILFLRLEGCRHC